MVIVITHKGCIDDAVDNEDGRPFPEWLEDSPAPLRRMYKTCGNRAVAIENSARDVEAKEEQVQLLLKTIQDMLDRNRQDYYTDENLENAERIMRAEAEKKRRDVEMQYNQEKRKAFELARKRIANIEQRKNAMGQPGFEWMRSESIERGVKTFDEKKIMLDPRHRESSHERTRRAVDRNFEHPNEKMMEEEEMRSKLMKLREKLRREIDEARKERKKSTKDTERLMSRLSSYKPSNEDAPRTNIQEERQKGKDMTSTTRKLEEKYEQAVERNKKLEQTLEKATGEFERIMKDLNEKQKQAEMEVVLETRERQRERAENTEQTSRCNIL